MLYLDTRVDMMHYHFYNAYSYTERTVLLKYLKI